MRRTASTYEARLLLVFCLVVLAAGLMAARAAAGNGNGGGGNASTSGQHGQDCAPGYNDTATGSCEHNGAGGGNCGDNQSGNDNGLGNDGNDNGFGNKGDRCAAASPPSNPPGSPAAPGGPTTTTTTTTIHSDPGSGTSTPVSVTCAASLRLGRTHFVVGRRAILAVRVRTAGGNALSGMTVLVRGAGIRLTSVTDSAGTARFTVRPRSAGVIRITLAQPSPCAAISRIARATGAFKPPKPNFTG